MRYHYTFPCNSVPTHHNYNLDELPITSCDARYLERQLSVCTKYTSLDISRSTVVAVFTSSNTSITNECRRVGNLQSITTRNITEIKSTSIFLRCRMIHRLDSFGKNEVLCESAGNVYSMELMLTIKVVGYTCGFTDYM